MKKLLMVLFLSICLPLTAQANEPWKFRLTPYMWFAGAKGKMSTIPGQPAAPIDVSASDAIDDTETSFMLIFEAKKGRHGFILDYFYSDVRSQEELVPAIGLKLKSTSESTFANAGYLYQLYRNKQATVDVFAGARYWDVDTKLAFGGGLGVLEGRTVRNAKDWVDPMVAFKARMRLGASRFFIGGSVGGGGGAGSGSDNFYDALASVGYQWTHALSTSVAYRVFDVDYDHGSFRYDVKQEGWALGLTWIF